MESYDREACRGDGISCNDRSSPIDSRITTITCIYVVFFGWVFLRDVVQMKLLSGCTVDLMLQFIGSSVWFLSAKIGHLFTKSAKIGHL